MRAVGTAQRSQEAGYGQACQVLAGVVRVFGTSQQRQPLLPGRTFLLQHKVVGVGCEHRQRDLLRTLAGKTNRAVRATRSQQAAAECSRAQPTCSGSVGSKPNGVQKQARGRGKGTSTASAGVQKQAWAQPATRPAPAAAAEQHGHSSPAAAKQQGDRTHTPAVPPDYANESGRTAPVANGASAGGDCSSSGGRTATAAQQKGASASEHPPPPREHSLPAPDDRTTAAAPPNTLPSVSSSTSNASEPALDAGEPGSRSRNSEAADRELPGQRGRTVHMVRQPTRALSAPPAAPRDVGTADASMPQQRGQTVRMVRQPMQSLSVPRGQPLTQSRGPDGRMIVCPQCGGRGVVRTPAGLQLCPGCQEWRRQNLLVDPSALDFSALDAMVDSAPPATKRKAKSARQPLTAEHREKIRSALKGRSMGERSVEHRRNIAESMKRLMANNDTHRARISQAMTGKPKICSHCGEEGHNKRTCPQLNPDRAAQGAPGTTVLKASAGSAAGKARRSVVCAHCGQSGHNVRSCPVLKQEQTASAAEAQTSTSAAAAQATALQGKPAGQPISTSAPGPATATSSVPAKPAPAKPTQPKAPARPPVEPPERFVVPVPVRAEEAVLQASGAILRAWQRGLRRLKVDFLLPPGPNARQPLLDQNGWPGGIRQQFRSAQPMVEGALRQLKQVPGLQGRLSADWLDETDCVGAWESETLAAVLFPTADSLHQLRELEGDRGGKRLVLIVNPQWQTAGQIVSDFGFGRSAKESETYVKSFQDVYCLKRVRFMGDEVRLLKCYPGDWQVHYIRPNGRVVLAGIEKEAPSYSRLEELLRTVPGTQAGRTWVERIIKPTKFGTGSGANALSAEAAAASAAPDDAASKPRSSPAALYAPTGAGDFGYRPDEADQLAAKKPLSSKRTSIRAAKAAASQPALDALASAASVAAQVPTSAEAAAADAARRGVSSSDAPPGAGVVRTSAEAATADVKRRGGATSHALPGPAEAASLSAAQRGGGASPGSAALRTADDVALRGRGRGAASPDASGRSETDQGANGRVEVSEGANARVDLRPSSATQGSDAVQAQQPAPSAGTQSGSLPAEASPAIQSASSDTQKRASPRQTAEPASATGTGSSSSGSSASASKPSRFGTSGIGSSSSSSNTSAGELGRFGDVDIITGLPVRDLKMEPVLQVARWQRALFGSQDRSRDDDSD